MTLATFDDVLRELPIDVQGAMSEQDLKDIIVTVARVPGAGAELLDAYRAANASIPPSAWDVAWSVIQTAATVAGIVTSIGGAVAMV